MIGEILILPNTYNEVKTMIIKNSNIIIILIMVLLIGTSGCVSTDDNGDPSDNDKNGESYFELFYEIQIVSNTSGELLFPIPFDSPNTGSNLSNEYSKIAEILSIEDGKGEIEIISTEKGYALKISYTEYVHISGKKIIESIESTEYDDYYFDQLTLKNESINKFYYIYSSNNYAQITNFICYFEHTGSIDSVRQEEWKAENYALKTGWNSIRMK
jgi:hypothetical protein